MPKAKKKREVKVNKSTGEVVEITPEVTQAEKTSDIEFKKDEPVHGFSLAELSVKMVDKSPVRTAKIVIAGHLPEVVFMYDILFFLNREPIEMKIKDVEAAKLQFESQEQEMINDFKIAEIEKFDVRIEGLKAELNKLVLTHPEISFSARVLKVDDSGDYQKFDFNIPEEALTKLNWIFAKLPKYKIQLQPKK